MRNLIQRVLFWTYQRGSLQYDILCALILAFIFLTPTSVFDGTLFTRNNETLSAPASGSLEQPVGDAVSVVARPAIDNATTQGETPETADERRPSDGVQ